jgi:hypothetical protein
MAAALIPCACSGSDHGSVTATSLTLTPCNGNEPATFAPFRLDASMLRWYDAGAGGGIELRAGFREPTSSDGATLLLANVASVRAHLRDDPVVPIPVDGKDVRVSLALRSTCPDGTQVVEGYDGSLTLMELDTGGRIAGLARFDLWDRRERDSGAGAPLARDVSMEFDFEVREGLPYEDFSD